MPDAAKCRRATSAARSSRSRLSKADRLTCGGGKVADSGKLD